jgi:hypothetical protein
MDINGTIVLILEVDKFVGESKIKKYLKNSNKTSQMPPKQKIPKALREQVWLHYIGKQYETKCPIVWCTNKINVYNFHVGHNVPESKGGTLDIKNLKPICSSCNLSMNDTFTIDEWNSSI